MGLMENKNDVTTLAFCWYINPEKGEQIGFTECDRDITIHNTIYRSNHSLKYSAIDSYTDMKDSDIEVMISVDHEIKNKLLAGFYDNAEVEIFMIDFMQLNLEPIKLFKGNIGKITILGKKLKLKLNNISNRLNNTIGEIYSPTCRADFCDSKCKLKKYGFSFNGEVTYVLDETLFYSEGRKEIDGFFNYGKLTMVSGDNKDIEVDIIENYSGNIRISSPFKFAIKPGDKYIIMVGCDKTLFSCYNKFNNAINFRGEPNIPGYQGLV